MKTLLQRFWEDETGATAVEYGLIVADAITWLFSDNSSKLVKAFAQ
ncbi:MAG: Flp family type IVb pilin [Mesorhizobium sp.]|nr:Flp family type IVb pilin [Mesorhizobium sp.]TIL70321.1 MAG: Flp family type IVb pilin [Mesorhizobium sp.]